MYYVYMLRCEDNSLYTGITTNIEKRMEEHFSKGKKCAKYTFVHTAKKLEVFWEADNRKEASRLEYYIKTLKKNQKEELIRDSGKLEIFIGDKIRVKNNCRRNLRRLDKKPPLSREVAAKG